MERAEQLTNILENTACRVAQLRAGRLSPHHVMPYLPVSLGMICECLDGMVDGAAVLAETGNGIKEYVFTAYGGQPEKGTVLSVSECVGCAGELDAAGTVLCSHCGPQFLKALSDLAEKTGWPAQAVYEHEILYLAAAQKGALAAETLAGASRYTLRSMKRKLDDLAARGFLKTEPGCKTGTLRYQFPRMDYPRNMYRKNRQVISGYPASVMEDVEQRIVRVLVALGCLFLVMLALAVWGVPFVMLVPAFLVSAPVVALVIWKHKSKVEEI